MSTFVRKSAKHQQNWSTSYHILINKLFLNMLTDRLHS